MAAEVARDPTIADDAYLLTVGRISISGGSRHRLDDGSVREALRARFWFIGIALPRTPRTSRRSAQKQQQLRSHWRWWKECGEQVWI